MSHYEQRLEADLKSIHEEVIAQAQRVESALKDAVHALLTGNKPLANLVIIGDMPINRAMRRIDRLCHAFIVRHLPSAGHLRLMSAIMRINIELERVGDYAVTIARESVQQPTPPEGMVARQIAVMADESQRMLAQARRAFTDRSDEAANATMAIADLVQGQFDVLFDELIEMDRSQPGSTKRIFGLLSVVNMLERVSDQAKNICEETVFAITGATKKRKQYRILFIESAPALRAPMACAIGRKTYVNSGFFDWAAPDGTADERLAPFLNDHGLALPSPAVSYPVSTTELGGYHVAVSLDREIPGHLAEIPYHTASFVWALGVPADALAGENFGEGMEAVYRELSVRIHQLMETLYGEDAD